MPVRHPPPKLYTSRNRIREAIMTATAAGALCPRCQRAIGEGLFCQYDGTFILDAEGTVVLGGRGERILAWFINALLVIFTLFIGWLVWWFIVAPRGQNPGKAIVGVRVIGADGRAVRTGGMFVRGLASLLASLIPLYLDNLWMLWDRDAQCLHDKLVNTVVVKAHGSEKIVERGSLGPPPAGFSPRPAFAPPIAFPSSSTSTPVPAAPAAAPSPEEALRQLDDLRAKNLITDEEYQAKRKAILDRL
jgi:uncharacterized RDD family membrane protein YckC